MTDFKERRKESRKKIMTFTPVYNQDKNMLLGYVRDLTLQGVLVIGEKTMDIDSEVNLVIELPPTLPNILTTYLKVSARVARCVNDESPRDYQIGFEFLDIKPEQTKIIEALLERYHFSHKKYEEWQDIES